MLTLWGNFHSLALLAQQNTEPSWWWISLSFIWTWLWWFIIPMSILFVTWLTLRYIPNNQVGIVEKLWSGKGSVVEGAIMALNGEAGYQADVLRGGIHFGYWRWQYSIHRVPLVTVPQGKIGYVYARDGHPLPASQTLAHVVRSNNFQDAKLFLRAAHEPGDQPVAGTTNIAQQGIEPTANYSHDTYFGQRGRQRAILREGVYAINLSLFVVITENRVYSLTASMPRSEQQVLMDWQRELTDIDGFSPVVVGKMAHAKSPDHKEPIGTSYEVRHYIDEADEIAIVTIHDGPSLDPGEIIAPTVGAQLADVNYHNNFQDIEAFLRAGGRRGRQYMALTDGTYFLNRWFATIEMIPKTVVPIGSVGVVVSYFGRRGSDTSGTGFRHGERVAEGERGVWEISLGPGKYPFNTYAGNIVLVPTTNFVLHWVTGRIESHRYDESLKSIDLVTRDAYEPLLPLSVVVHIDYQRAPNVIQRFGDVKQLITQTLDPMLSAYFRDIAHRKTMLELLHDRAEIQREAREELRLKFHEFDIECVDVLIGKPETHDASGKIETLLDQLRERQLSKEQLETYDRKREAAEKMRIFNEAEAQAKLQTQLTTARVQAQVAEAQGEAELARARKAADQTIVTADAELARSRRQAEQTVLLAEANSQQRILEGRGEGQKVLQIGLGEAAVLQRKVNSYGDPRLYAMSLITEDLSKSTQPLVPERMFVSGGGGDGSGTPFAQGILGTLIQLLVAEKTGFAMHEVQNDDRMKEFTDKMTAQVMESMERGNAAMETPEQGKGKSA